ncbi:MAG: hypothetical protein ABII90_06170 [Bacteroidota bacterium]
MKQSYFVADHTRQFSIRHLHLSRLCWTSWRVISECDFNFEATDATPTVGIKSWETTVDQGFTEV